MNRSMHGWPTLLLFVLGAASLAGCGKQETEPVSVNIPVPSVAKVPADMPAPSAAPPADSAAAAPATPPASAAAPAAVGASPSAAPPGVLALPAGRGGSIDGCCAALSAVQKSGTSGVTKAKAASAAASCPAIAKLVKEGKTSRSAALTQIKSALVGIAPPPECN